MRLDNISNSNDFFELTSETIISKSGIKFFFGGI